MEQGEVDEQWSKLEGALSEWYPLHRVAGNI